MKTFSILSGILAIVAFGCMYFSHNDKVLVAALVEGLIFTLFFIHSTKRIKS